jgi:hypothetical protein
MCFLHFHAIRVPVRDEAWAKLRQSFGKQIASRERPCHRRQLPLHGWMNSSAQLLPAAGEWESRCHSKGQKSFYQTFNHSLQHFYVRLVK